MSPLPLILFALTYLGLALGRVRGLALDRTGLAVIGAAAFLATGQLDLEQAKAAIDAPTLIVLFGMMMLSAQYRAAGLYTLISDRLVAVGEPRRLLLGTIVVAASLSALLTNDVVCFALAPLLAAGALRAGRDPLPFLLALACASNIGGALTPIGNPQNILIAQSLGLPFLPFVLACALPVLASLVFLFFWLARRLPTGGAAITPKNPAVSESRLPDSSEARIPLDRLHAAKALLLTFATAVLFLSPVPAWLTALSVAGLVLTSRRLRTRELLSLIDWHLLALFMGLFVVVRGLETSGWTAAADEALRGAGVDLTEPLVLVPVAAILSNLVSNVPAVMLLLPFATDPAAGAPTQAAAWLGHGLALASSLAGNAVLVGSIANLIVAEQAQRLGIRFGFRDHLRTGLPVTLFSLLATAIAMTLARPD